MPMTKRRAIRMIHKKGGKFVEHGKKHDVYEVNGTRLEIPRHSGDLSVGVEMEIRAALGK
jgi:hypothetical protein